MLDAMSSRFARCLAVARCEWLAFHRLDAWRGGAALGLLAALLAAAGARGDDLRGAAVQDLLLWGTGGVGAMVALLLGSQVIAREVRDRTWMVVLATPVSRLEFLVGKFLGVAAVLAEVALVGGVSLVGAMLVSGPWAPGLLALLPMLWLQWCLAAALAVLFATLTSGPLALLYASALFLLGHAGGLVRTFAESEAKLSALNHWGGLVFYHLIPHFELFDQRAALLGGRGPDLAVVGAAALYGCAMIAAWLALADLAWRHREL